MTTYAYRYALIATNKDCAIQVYKSNIKSEVLRMFDDNYTREGFKITIIDYETNKTIIIKKTYR